MWWAGYATAGVFCAWLLIRVGYQKRKNPLKNSMWQLIFIMIGAILWDYATGWIGWSVDFAIPLAVLLNGVTMQILARAYKMEVSEYLFYLMQSGAAGIVPAILWLTGTVRITWPSVICVGLSVLYLIGLFFFRGKDFMREMQKKIPGMKGKGDRKIRRAGKKSGCWSLFLPCSFETCVCLRRKSLERNLLRLSSQPQESHDGISSPFLIASRTAL